MRHASATSLQAFMEHLLCLVCAGLASGEPSTGCVACPSMQGCSWASLPPDPTLPCSGPRALLEDTAPSQLSGELIVTTDFLNSKMHMFFFSHFQNQSVSYTDAFL